MKKLILISVLLFSVDVHSVIDSGEVCVVRDNTQKALEEKIEEKRQITQDCNVLWCNFLALRSEGRRMTGSISVRGEG